MVTPSRPFSVRVRELPKVHEREDTKKWIEEEFGRMKLKSSLARVREKNEELQACVHFSNPNDVQRALECKTIRIHVALYKLTQCCTQNGAKGWGSTAHSTAIKEEPSTCPETNSDGVSDMASSRCPSTETETSTTSSHSSKSNDENGYLITKQMFATPVVKEIAVHNEKTAVMSERKGKSSKEKKGKRMKKKDPLDEEGISKEGDIIAGLSLPQTGFRNFFTSDIAEMKYVDDLGGKRDMDDNGNEMENGNSANDEGAILGPLSNKQRKDNQKRRNAKEPTKPSDQKQVIKTKDDESIPDMKLPSAVGSNIKASQTSPAEAEEGLTKLLPKIDWPPVAHENASNEEPAKVKRSKRKRSGRHKSNRCEKKSH